mmetsp:Transcript_23038/g.71777  ORF Transcript_23038/g.71777 Transcript_23038/m.71777 type:complete len:93 (-) Transcript_23038:21-299(-)
MPSTRCAPALPCHSPPAQSSPAPLTRVCAPSQRLGKKALVLDPKLSGPLTLLCEFSVLQVRARAPWAARGILPAPSPASALRLSPRHAAALL